MRYFFLILFVISTLAVYSASDNETDVKDLPTIERIFIGGYIGLQFGSITFIDIAPVVGYRITNRLSAGTGLIYQYYNQRLDHYGGDHRYGGKVFSRFLVIPQAFLHAEFEKINIETFDFSENAYGNRFWEDNVFLGAGYRAQLGEKAFFNIMILYNFNENSSVYHQNPIYRFSIEVGL